MTNSLVRTAIFVGLAANGLLLALKTAATNWSDSLTIFSETLNSLSDFIGAIIVLVFVLWANRQHDDDHPFGHGRAEPIAGLMLAVFAGILGIEVVRHAAITLASGESPRQIGAMPILVLGVAIVIKGGLVAYFRWVCRRLHSPAFRAQAVECRNDVLVAVQALIGVTLAQLNYGVFDGLSALLVGLYIVYSAFQIAMENIDYLMGKAPREELYEVIEAAADSVDHVQQVGDLRAHYVGTGVHVELTARVEPALPTTESHDVAEGVRAAVEAIPEVDRAFVHIEPTTNGRQ